MHSSLRLPCHTVHGNIVELAGLFGSRWVRLAIAAVVSLHMLWPCLPLSQQLFETRSVGLVP